MALPGLTRAQADLRYAPLAVEGFTASLGSSAALSPVRPLRAVFTDGYLYSTTGQGVFRTLDITAGWTTIATLPVGFQVNNIREAGDGEVLIVNGTVGVYKSSGWAANPTTATWTQVLDTLGAPVRPWGWDVYPHLGWVVATTYLGTGDYSAARYVWLSKDFGATWSVIYDLNAVHPTLDTRYRHPHHAVFDPYTNPESPRIWITYHKTAADPTNAASPLIRVRYSDDAGITWTTYTDETTSLHHPVVAVATPAGMVFDTDTNPQALYVVDRTPSMTKRQLIALADPTKGWATSSFRAADGTAHIAFKSDSATPGYPGYIVSTDGVIANKVLTLPPASGTESVEIDQVLVYGSSLMFSWYADAVSGSTRQYFKGTVPTHSNPASTDRGQIVPGDNGLLGWAFDPVAIATSAIPTAGTLQLSRMRIPKGSQVTHLFLIVTVAGATLTAGRCVAALYDSTGKRLGVTADQATNWQSTGAKSMALSAPATVTTDYVYVAFYWNGTTGPTFARNPNTGGNVGLAAGAYRFATADTGLTTAMPATFGTQASSSFCFWAGAS